MSSIIHFLYWLLLLPVGWLVTWTGRTYASPQFDRCVEKAIKPFFKSQRQKYIAKQEENKHSIYRDAARRRTWEPSMVMLATGFIVLYGLSVGFAVYVLVNFPFSWNSNIRILPSSLTPLYMNILSCFVLLCAIIAAVAMKLVSNWTVRMYLSLQIVSDFDQLIAARRILLTEIQIWSLQQCFATMQNESGWEKLHLQFETFKALNRKLTERRVDLETSKEVLLIATAYCAGATQEAIEAQIVEVSADSFSAKIP